TTRAERDSRWRDRVRSSGWSSTGSGLTGGDLLRRVHAVAGRGGAVNLSVGGGAVIGRGPGAHAARQALLRGDGFDVLDDAVHGLPRPPPAGRSQDVGLADVRGD